MPGTAPIERKYGTDQKWTSASQRQYGFWGMVLDVKLKGDDSKYHWRHYTDTKQRNFFLDVERTADKEPVDVIRRYLSVDKDRLPSYYRKKGEVKAKGKVGRPAKNSGGGATSVTVATKSEKKKKNQVPVSPEIKAEREARAREANIRYNKVKAKVNRAKDPKKKADLEKQLAKANKSRVRAIKLSQKKYTYEGFGSDLLYNIKLDNLLEYYNIVKNFNDEESITETILARNVIANKLMENGGLSTLDGMNGQGDVVTPQSNSTGSGDVFSYYRKIKGEKKNLKYKQAIVESFKSVI